MKDIHHTTMAVNIGKVCEELLFFRKMRISSIDSRLAGPVLPGPILNSAAEKLMNLNGVSLRGRGYFDEWRTKSSPKKPTCRSLVSAGAER